MHNLPDARLTARAPKPPPLAGRRVSCEVLARGGASRAAQACAAAAPWGCWCAAQAAHAHCRHYPSVLRSATSLVMLCLAWGSRKRAPAETPCERRQRALRHVQALARFSACAADVAAVLVRPRILGCHDGARARGWMGWARWVLLLQWQGHTAGQLVRTAACHLFSCADALYVSCASVARGWLGRQSTVMLLLCGAVARGCSFANIAQTPPS